MLVADKNIDRLERDLRQAILTGVLAPSSKLISVRSLAEQYQVTYGRTLRALKRLEKQGMLVTRRGGGTYVTDSVLTNKPLLQRADNGESTCAIIVAPANYWTGGEGLWFAEFIRGFEAHVAESGANLKIVTRDDYIKNAASFPSSARTHVILSSFEDEQLELIRKGANDKKTTFVLVAFDPVHSSWATVMEMDAAASFKEGVTALNERGHSEITLLSWTLPSTTHGQWWWVKYREAAYEEAMTDLKCKPEIIHLPFVSDTPASRKVIHEQLTRLLKNVKRRTALLCVNDFLARFVMEAATKLKLNIPADLSILGFDDDPWSVSAGLSTFHRPYRELGQMAGQMAIQNQRRTGSCWQGYLTIKPQLILRSSVGIAPLK
jgi:DNA-binding LacI/PurR family transcriptional regulator